MMSWLCGKPCRVVTITWPTNDTLIQQASASSYVPPGTYSILDDQVLRAFTARDSNKLYTSIYLARLHQEISSGASTATFVKMTKLTFTVHRISLLPDNAGFATLEFIQRAKNITLRTHNWQGAILKQITTEAAAAYGDFVITGHIIAICVSSGLEASPGLNLAGSPSPAYRVDTIPFSGLAEIRGLTGDRILVWNSETEMLNVVSIPQSDRAPLVHYVRQHDAAFQLIRNAYIAMGGKVLHSFGRPSALLKCFAIGDPEGTDRTFSHGSSFERDDDIGVVARPGSSAPNAILLNYHHLDGRFTVVKNELLTGEIDSQPSSDNPPGLHQFWDHPQMARTLEGTLSQFLPSISDNRVLVSVRIEDEDERFTKFAVMGQDKICGSILFLYDFDQKRCEDLLNLTELERSLLENRLREANNHAQVSIVERNFRAGIEEEDDTEYYLGIQPPQGYLDRLQGIRQANESRRIGVDKIPVLEYDEAPVEKENTPRVLFTRSAVWLPEDNDTRNIDPRNLALTSSGVVYPPLAGKNGFLFLFESS